MSWLPIRYREFYDVPRAFVAIAPGGRYLFDCAFDEGLDEYPGVYRVYRLPLESEVALEAASWVGLERGAEFVGEVAIDQVQFDVTRRAAVDASVLELLGGARDQAT